MKTRYWLAALLCAGIAGAEGFSGPVSGVVFDPGSGRLRRINGVPGAAVLGPAVELPFRLAQAGARARGRVVAITDEAPRRVVTIATDRDTPAVTVIEGALEDAVGMGLSRAGSAAVVYTADRLQVISGLGGTPVAGSRVALPEGVRAAAVSDDGSVALAATASGVYRVLRGGTAEAVNASAQIAALEVVNGGRDGIALDVQGRQVLLLADVAGGAGAATLAGEADGLDSPAAMAVTRDGGTVLVTNRESGTVVAVSTAWQFAARAVAAPTVAGGCARIGEGDIFLLSEAAARPLYVLDLSDPSTGGQVFFVPVE